MLFTIFSRGICEDVIGLKDADCERQWKRCVSLCQQYWHWSCSIIKKYACLKMVVIIVGCVVLGYMIFFSGVHVSV